MTKNYIQYKRKALSLPFIQNKRGWFC